MNHIEVRKIKTCYEYSQNYFIIDNIPITTYIDSFVKEKDNSSLSGYGSLLGLLPAWSGELEWQWENDFVWELVDSNEELNVPILVCEDDCDLSCVVIMVHVHKEEGKVYWDRIGALSHNNYNRQEEQKCGILCLEAYSEDDWAKYGDNIATEKYGSEKYWEWVNANCYEENIRRLRNYMNPYMQDDENVNWIKDVDWIFDENEYKGVIEKYRKIKNSELLSPFTELS